MIEKNNFGWTRKSFFLEEPVGIGQPFMNTNVFIAKCVSSSETLNQFFFFHIILNQNVELFKRQRVWITTSFWSIWRRYGVWTQFSSLSLSWFSFGIDCNTRSRLCSLTFISTFRNLKFLTSFGILRKTT